MTIMSKEMNLHDSVLTYLIENNFSYFRSPIYLIDKEFEPLRELLKSHSSYPNQKELEDVWRVAKRKNDFYRELLDRFSNSIHTKNVINYLGDFIVEKNNNWHIVKLKTSENSSSIFHFNIESILAFRSFPQKYLPYLYVLFYNDFSKVFQISRFSNLLFKPYFYHYPELSPDLKLDVQKSLPRFSPRLIDKENASKDIDKTAFVYLSIDLLKQKPGTLIPLQQFVCDL